MLFKDLLKVMGNIDCEIIKWNPNSTSSKLIFKGNYFEVETDDYDYILDLEVNKVYPKKDILLIIVY